jgi:hypothetical protein
MLSSENLNNIAMGNQQETKGKALFLIYAYRVGSSETMRQQ